MTRIAVANPDVVFREEDDEGFLFDPETGKIKLLNHTATEIFRLLDGSRSRDQIIDHMVSTYNAPAEVLEKDLDEFLAELKTRNLLVEQDL